MARARADGLSLGEAEEFEAVPGHGVRGRVDGRQILLGNAKFQESAGVALDYFDYSGYPEYPQRFGGFEHAVTVLDLLFNAGPQAPRYMKTFA